MAREIYRDPQLEDLAQTPLALYMFAQIAQNSQQTLPRNRGVLFEVFIDNLLARGDGTWWSNYRRSNVHIPLDFRKRVLAQLGLSMQQEEAWAFPYNRWREIISTNLDGEAFSVDDVQTIINHSGLLRYLTHLNAVEFAHHTYQEFFAALALRQNGENVEPYLHDLASRRRWQGIMVLLYGITEVKSTLYSQILGQDDNYARIWLGAQCLANSGDDMTSSLQVLERALPLQQYFALLFSVGLASRMLGRYAEALTYLVMATEQNPASAEVQYELGSLYRQVEQYERAIERLEEAIRLRADFVDAYNLLGLTYHDQQKYHEALTIFKATTQLEPINPHHYYNMGIVQKLLRDYTNAKASFSHALTLKPDYPEAKGEVDLLDKALSTGVVQVLDSIPILRKMTLDQSIVLANYLGVEEYQPGQIVFHMGEMGEKFYIIEVGAVEVLAPEMPTHSTKQMVINRLEPGNFFGEIALLRTVPRTATIRAIKPTRLLTISREDFNNVIRQFPTIANKLAETSSLRLLNDRQLGRRVAIDRYYDPGYIAELTQHTEVTVVMGDIHGSTYLTNRIGPVLMVAFLDEYLLRMSTIIVQAGGAMDKSLGDSVMGVFGNFPDRHEDEKINSANSAILAALKMREAYITLRDEWVKEHPEFAETGMGVGISTGKITTGTVGAESTMVGPAVNMSSKLSKMAISGRTESAIYIDDRTLSLVGEAFPTEQLGYDYTKKRVGIALNAYRVIP